jgi:A/G-specific adenine glycosylase
MDNDEFTRLLRQQGEELYRDMPWRRDTRPYFVLVSELMLQQTQVDRVIPKFEAFIATFPDEKALADASLADVLRQWQGLGYNRRAKFLHEAAKKVIELGGFPQDEVNLQLLPGVGKNTAGAIMAYAYNQPAMFIETNVRAVYIHHFFNDMDLVDDRDIIEIMKETVPWAEGKEQPERRIHSAPGAMRKTVGLSYGPKAFYWALMDYGSWLKKQGVTPNRSRHYKKQAPLKGSVREVRGQIISVLAAGDMNESELRVQITADERFVTALGGLIKDGLVTETVGKLHLTK